MRTATNAQMGRVREARLAAWQRCVADAVALARGGLASTVTPLARVLVEQLQPRVRRVWELRWGNRWKEVWWRLLLHGVKGAGGHGWAWAGDKACVCGWQPLAGSDAHTRAFQQRAHVFWGCPCAQAVVQCVRERVVGASVLPVQVWLLGPSPLSVGHREWWVLALAALNAMVVFRGVFARSGADQVQVKTRALLDLAWQDFCASQP